ncbi:origin recognition complex subunit 5-like [Haliotis asinina]|uniref:origin recognition complex subunit 5-like n=1 Tax=Haliotis asinina TaxID=109174 RepID=UPI0035322D2D
MPVEFEGYSWGHDPADLENLKKRTPCRSSQIEILLQLFGEAAHYTPPALFVYGHTATGKSCIVNGILRSLKLPHVPVNCVECYSSRFLYEHILNNLPSSDTNTRCDNMNDFVRLLQQGIQQCQLQDQTVYVVLDKAERLRDMEANILPAFLRLQELTGMNVCTIMLSEIVWEKFRFGTGFSEPYLLHFPDYSKNELLEIMSLDAPTDYPAALYGNYINLIMSVFHLVCRDLKELQHLASLNFSKYIEPIEKEEATVNDFRKLWKNIEPHLKKALQTIYLREISSSQWEKLQQEQDSASLNPIPASRSHVELPYYSKYLLIAAYLASYNPVKSDRRFFVKHTTKTRTKPQTAKAKKHERASNHLLGPKPFPLDRLLAIFYSIVEGKVAPTAIIYSQITSLVSLHLLGPAAGEDQIDMPRYKCLVSLDFIKSVARTVSFEVTRYLYDFA